jgi:hypothetical protein
MQDERTANDVGVWGDRALGNENYEEPFEIAGERVDLGNLPPLGDGDVCTGDGSGRPA